MTADKNKARQLKKTILVVSDVASDATMVQRLLEPEYDRVFVSTKADMEVQDFDDISPDVMVLAFNSVEKSERYYLGLFRLGSKVNSRRHKTVILCNKDEVNRAYQLCRTGHFDDYVLFWPANHDAPRLLMSIHQSFRELSAGLAAEMSTPLPVVATPTSTQASSATILVVDDDGFQHKLVKALLKAESYNLLFAHSGQEAIDIIGKTKPNLVFMDMNMPEMSGIEATRLLKAMPQMADLQVIMVTGNSDRDAVRESLKAGATDFIVKPLVRDVLLAKIKHVLE